jgi:hypothetical protein
VHNTNGCTYGSELACPNHGPREQVTSYEKPGATLAKRAAYTAVGARGVWCKGAIWRKVKVAEPLPLTRALDVLARAKVEYVGPGVLIRKRATK